MMVSINDRIYAMLPGRKPIAICAIEPEKAARALESQGCRPDAARIIAFGGLDSAAAQRLGRQYGLIEEARHALA